ncbi:MAG: hypothetical protein AAFR17_05655 [Pseudomonadota bacterium]
MTSLAASTKIDTAAAPAPVKPVRNVPTQPATWSKGFRVQMIARHLLGSWILRRFGINGL